MSKNLVVNPKIDKYSAIFDRDYFEMGDRLLGVEELIKIPVRGETRIVCKIMLSEPDRC
jgi:hypothetical protein